MILVGWLVMGVCLGVIATWLIGLRHTSTLLDQASELGREFTDDKIRRTQVPLGKRYGQAK
jgi:hypothetical protein